MKRKWPMPEEHISVHAKLSDEELDKKLPNAFTKEQKMELRDIIREVPHPYLTPVLWVFWPSSALRVCEALAEIQRKREQKKDEQ